MTEIQVTGGWVEGRSEPLVDVGPIAEPHIATPVVDELFVQVEHHLELVSAPGDNEMFVLYYIEYKAKYNEMSILTKKRWWKTKGTPRATVTRNFPAICRRTIKRQHVAPEGSQCKATLLKP